MPNNFLSYNAVTVSPITDGVQIPVPQTPESVDIAAVKTSATHAFPNVVELKATVGIRADVSVGSVLFRIFRDAQEIYNARQGMESNFEKFYLTTLQAIDVSAQLGSHDYTLTVESLSPGFTATVIGPINFSASVFKATKEPTFSSTVNTMKFT
jgi:hypothetical protein